MTFQTGVFLNIPHLWSFWGQTLNATHSQGSAGLYSQIKGMYLLRHFPSGRLLYPGKHSQEAASPSPLQYEYGLQVLHLVLTANDTDTAADCERQSNFKHSQNTLRRWVQCVSPDWTERKPFGVSSPDHFSCRLFRLRDPVWVNDGCLWTSVVCLTSGHVSLLLAEAANSQSWA